MTCRSCIHGRLICNKEKRAELVGCSLTVGIANVDALIYVLDKVGYRTSSDELKKGWFFYRIPFNSQSQVTCSGSIVEGLISDPDSICALYVQRPESS